MSEPQTPSQTSAEVALITVEGYSPRYARAARKLLQIEGGFVDDPKDRGGATKYGISLRFLAAEGAFDEDADGKSDFDLDLDGDIDGRDIRLLTRGDAIFLYHKCFWVPLQADTFPQPIGEMLFDQAVNGGARAARKLLQRAINTCVMHPGFRAARPNMAVTVDGQIGPQTRRSLAEVMKWPTLGKAAVVDAYRDAVSERYRAIVRRFPSQQRFLKGWLARAAELGSDV
ncbi:MAG: hypothetical protein K2Q27_08375 [Novosphingobium sp.]|nr:hypothetical protein [Novosphingobium sp.]